MVKVPQLVQMYKDGLMNPLQQIEFVQTLLDTELIADYPELDKLAQYTFPKDYVIMCQLISCQN